MGRCSNCVRLHAALGEATDEVNLLKEAISSPPHASADEPDDTIAIYRMLIVKARSQLRGVQAQLAAERQVSADLRRSIRRMSHPSPSSPHLASEPVEDLRLDESAIPPALSRCHNHLDHLDTQLAAMQNISAVHSPS
ncbi:hypothetical protein DYB36_004339 [Aphanomyces astaci]|uniref:Uncharacterized protein n=1 Tax=Aphanomyces astaci TaxID=112090 RepID=A0A397B2Z1_APHAT|nr:hypothetical protein DYB36_004339 [Aphanomyces astaci]